MTDNQKAFVEKVKGALATYKEENRGTEFITLTALQKLTGLGKGRLRDTIRRGKIGMAVATVPNINKEGKEEGEVTQFQISL